MNESGYTHFLLLLLLSTLSNLLEYRLGELLKWTNSKLTHFLCCYFFSPLGSVRVLKDNVISNEYTQIHRYYTFFSSANEIFQMKFALCSFSIFFLPFFSLHVCQSFFLTDFYKRLLQLFLCQLKWKQNNKRNKIVIISYNIFMLTEMLNEIWKVGTDRTDFEVARK